MQVGADIALERGCGGVWACLVVQLFAARTEEERLRSSAVRMQGGQDFPVRVGVAGVRDRETVQERGGGRIVVLLVDPDKRHSSPIRDCDPLAGGRLKPTRPAPGSPHVDYDWVAV